MKTLIRNRLFYSYLKAFIGFLLATPQVCELTVNKATAKAITGPVINAHIGIGVRKKNLPRNICPVRNAIGKAIRKAMLSHLV